MPSSKYGHKGKFKKPSICIPPPPPPIPPPPPKTEPGDTATVIAKLCYEVDEYEPEEICYEREITLARQHPAYNYAEPSPPDPPNVYCDCTLIPPEEEYGPAIEGHLWVDTGDETYNAWYGPDDIEWVFPQTFYDLAAHDEDDEVSSTTYIPHVDP